MIYRYSMETEDPSLLESHPFHWCNEIPERSIAFSTMWRWCHTIDHVRFNDIHEDKIQQLFLQGSEKFR